MLLVTLLTNDWAHSWWFQIWFETVTLRVKAKMCYYLKMCVMQCCFCCCCCHRRRCCRHCCRCYLLCAAFAVVVDGCADCVCVYMNVYDCEHVLLTFQVVWTQQHTQSRSVLNGKSLRAYMEILPDKNHLCVCWSIQCVFWMQQNANLMCVWKNENAVTDERVACTQYKYRSENLWKPTRIRRTVRICVHSVKMFTQLSCMENRFVCLLLTYQSSQNRSVCWRQRQTQASKQAG